MIGVVVMAHEQLRRTAQVARYLADGGCKVAVHIDARTGPDEVGKLTSLLGNSHNIVLSPRRRCDWGAFSLVEACLDALQVLFDRWPEITHVCQLSGSCLPIKPVAALQAHLAAHPGVDFIDSVAVEEDPWVVDGLSIERFTLYHLLPWRRYRWLFDRNVELQRALGIKRRMPEGLAPRIGSQWWCLSRQTLDAILADPRLPEYRNFFRLAWIPDESFFQTLAAKHSDHVAGKSLTFARFDAQGKPFVFYDDHRELLLHSDAYFARKIWGGAKELYRTFLGPDLAAALPEKSDGGRMLREFERATLRHRQGRRGLISQGRHPGRRLETQHETARPYTVIDGLDLVCPELMAELGRYPDVTVHGRLFARDRVELAGGSPVFAGNLSDSVAIRDYKPVHFLTKLIWIDRHKSQCFLHDFAGESPMSRFIASDPNARIIRLEDAWLLELCRIWRETPERLSAAADTAMAAQAETAAMLAESPTRARVVTVSLCDILRPGPGLTAKLSECLPDGVAHGGLVSGTSLPEDLGNLLEQLNRLEKGPAHLFRLTEAVRDFERMARVLRRKT